MNTLIIYQAKLKIIAIIYFYLNVTEIIPISMEAFSILLFPKLRGLNQRAPLISHLKNTFNQKG